MQLSSFTLTRLGAMQGPQAPQLKRPGSSAGLAQQQPLPKRACIVTAASAEQRQPSAMDLDSVNTAAAAAAAPAAAAASPVPGVDVLAVAAKHGWDLSQQGGAERWAGDRQVRWLRVDEITRPLAGSRSNDPEKVAALMASISEVGQQEPIDVLEVDGRYWGFSGCHRYEAHQRLGAEHILCRVRKATPQVLRMHMM